MDYFDTLRRNGWLTDPSDRVRVVAIHEGHCPTRFGRPCRCTPRLVLCQDRPPNKGQRAAFEPMRMDVASGE